GQGGVGAGGHGAEDTGEERARREGTRGVVPHHDIDVVGHARQAGPYRVRAGRPADRDMNAGRRLPIAPRGEHDHDPVARLPGDAGSTVEDTRVAETRELFRGTDARAAPRGTGDPPGL